MMSGSPPRAVGRLQWNTHHLNTGRRTWDGRGRARSIYDAASLAPGRRLASGPGCTPRVAGGAYHQCIGESGAEEASDNFVDHPSGAHCNRIGDVCGHNFPPSLTDLRGETAGTCGSIAPLRTASRKDGLGISPQAHPIQSDAGAQHLTDTLEENLPSFKLIDKTRDGSITVKRCSPPTTPCDRLIQHETTGDEMRAALFSTGPDWTQCCCCIPSEKPRRPWWPRLHRK